jgi:hypothetical protein
MPSRLKPESDINPSLRISTEKSHSRQPDLQHLYPRLAGHGYGGLMKLLIILTSSTVENPTMSQRRRSYHQLHLCLYSGRRRVINFADLLLSRK